MGLFDDGYLVPHTVDWHCPDCMVGQTFEYLEPPCPVPDCWFCESPMVRGNVWKIRGMWTPGRSVI